MMTRNELLDLICPSTNIGDCCSEDCLFGCDDCQITLGYMLDEYDKQIRADVIEEFRKYLKSVTPCEMPQEYWDMGVDNTCDRMLKEQNNESIDRI